MSCLFSWDCYYLETRQKKIEIAYQTYLRMRRQGLTYARLPEYKLSHGSLDIYGGPKLDLWWVNSTETENEEMLSLRDKTYGKPEKILELYGWNIANKSYEDLPSLDSLFKPLSDISDIASYLSRSDRKDHEVIKVSRFFTITIYEPTGDNDESERLNNIHEDSWENDFYDLNGKRKYLIDTLYGLLFLYLENCPLTGVDLNQYYLIKKNGINLRSLFLNKKQTMASNLLQFYITYILFREVKEGDLENLQDLLVLNKPFNEILYRIQRSFEGSDDPSSFQLNYKTEQDIVNKEMGSTVEFWKSDLETLEEYHWKHISYMYQKTKEKTIASYHFVIGQPASYHEVIGQRELSRSDKEGGLKNS